MKYVYIRLPAFLTPLFFCSFGFFLKTNLIFLQRVPFFLFEDKKAATHPSSSLLIRRTFIFRVLFWLMAKNPSREKRKTKEPKSSSDRNSDGARENALRRSRVTRVTERDARFGHILFCGAKGLNHVLIHFCSLCRELARRTDTQSS